MHQPIDQTVRDGLLRYQSQVSILKKGFAQESYRVASILKHPIAEMLMRDVKSPDIARYRDDRLAQPSRTTGKPISAATVRLEMSLLSSMFDIGLIEWGTNDSNPVSKVRKPKSPPGRDRRLLPREERLIMRYCSNHPTGELQYIVALALETAMRQGELLKLQWEHINLRTGIAHLPETKNGTKRDVPLSLRAREIFAKLGSKTKGRVFSYTSNGLKSAWRIMCQRLKIEDLHFHDLRHEACSRLFELNRLDIMEIASITGHKSLAMLKRYTHLKAARLVKKLEGHGSRGQQVVMSYLIPYPAVIESDADQIRVRVLDFEDVIGTGSTTDAAVSDAQNALLRRLMCALREKSAIPLPDQYLELIDEDKVFMLDPLPRIEMSQGEAA